MKKVLRSLGLLVALSLFGTAAFAGILKKPYLIYEGQNTTMTVLWQDTATETTNTLSWGTDTSYALGSVTVLENAAPAGTNPMTGQPYPLTNQHKFKITGLQPSTKYFYKVEDATNGIYGAGSFITAPANDATSVKFLAFGDTRSGPLAMEGVAQEMRKAYAADPAFQSINIQAGDWVASDAESNWTNEWFNANPQTRLMLSEQPVNGVKGNHENSSGYSFYFPKYYPYPYPHMSTIDTNSSSKPYPRSNNFYWSFDYGPVHFTIVDQYSGYTKGSAQYDWVENDLKTTTKPWKVLVYHEPAWTAGTHGNNTTTQATFDPLIKKYKVDLIYSGHNHNYARCQVDNYAQAGSDSIVPQVPYITNGGGGAGLYAVDTTNTGSYRHVVKALSQYEYSTFEINDKTLTMKAYAVTKADGTTLSASVVNPDTKSALIETVVINHPLADAGQDLTIGSLQEQCGIIEKGTASITNNVPLQYRWLEGENEVLSWSDVGANGEANLDLCKVSKALGQHTLQLEVTDGQHKASDDMELTINDTTPPTLTADANKTHLWPPLHNMVDISIKTDAQDNSGVKPAISAVVTSNELEDGLGDGDTAPDMTSPVIDQATGKISLQLRAERSGTGAGRVYTVAVTATDAAGNSTTAPVKIVVPHDMGQ